MTAGYSGSPLEKKLGLKEGLVVKFINQPDHYFDLFEVLPDNLRDDVEEAKDFIHYFTSDAEELKKRLQILKKEIKPNGAIWISWPKRSSKIPSTVDENIVREYALECGLVDVKVCAVDKVWSGLKLVIPVKDRP